MSEIKHTPTPWALVQSEGGMWHIRSGEDYVGSCMYINDMRHTITAVNAYDKQRALIETQQAALKALDDWWTGEFPGGPDDPKNSTGFIVLSDDTLDIWRTVRAAIAAAKKEGF